MNFLPDIFVFLIGLAFGSFANVVIYRLPKNISLLIPASFCPSCRKKISWYDNIPVLSFLILGGRCRFCRSKISIVYPVVELVAGLTFLLLKLKFSADILGIFIWCLFFLDLIIISGIDFSTRTIPDILSLGLIPIGLIFSPGNYLLGTNIASRMFNSLAGFLVNGLFMYLLALLSAQIFRKESLGGGDIKLVAGIGAFLGVGAGLSAIFWGAIIGSLIVLGLIVMKKISRSDYLPFGPFLVAGAYIVVFVPQSSKILTFT